MADDYLYGPRDRGIGGIDSSFRVTGNIATGLVGSPSAAVEGGHLQRVAMTISDAVVRVHGIAAHLETTAVRVFGAPSQPSQSHPETAHAPGGDIDALHASVKRLHEAISHLDRVRQPLMEL